MKFTLSINMVNDAFDPFPGSEAADILHALASRMEFSLQPGDGGDLLDTNGNTVGSWAVTEVES